jgi:4-hydroxy-3-polyprenylbenzoate decarboxylase
MAYASLADFLEDLLKTGQLARVGVDVDGELEVAEITRRAARADGPAILFERVCGGSTAVVTNLLGTVERVCLALSIDSLDEITTRVESLIEQNTPQNWFDRLKTSTEDAGAGKFRPKTVKSGPCQQVVRLGRDVDLNELPLLKHWQQESGRSITGARLIAQRRADQTTLVDLRGLVALDANRLALVESATSAFGRLLAEYRSVNEKLPLAVVLGGDPAGTIAASLEVPRSVDCYHVAGLLRGQAMEVVKCRTHGLEVPADADLVLEGYIDTQEPGAAIRLAAPGGSHFQVESDAPVVHVSAITQRTHPILPLMVDCGEHGEGPALAKVRERMLLPAVRAAAPAVADLHFPSYGGRDRFAFVSIRKSFAYQARQVASALWGSKLMENAAFLIIVDDAVDVYDTERILAEIGANAGADQDVFTFDGPAPASERGGESPPLVRRMAIDATTKIAGERAMTPRSRLAVDADVAALVTSRWTEYQVDTTDRGQ